MATELDIEFFLDETLTIDAVLTGLDGEPANLTGLTAADIQWGMAVARGHEPVVSVSLSDTPDPDNGIGGVTLIDAPNGVCRIQLGSAEQDDLEPRKYWHECRAVFDDGISIQFQGRATVKKSIFQDPAET